MPAEAVITDSTAIRVSRGQVGWTWWVLFTEPKTDVKHLSRHILGELVDYLTVPPTATGHKGCHRHVASHISQRLVSNYSFIADALLMMGGCCIYFYMREKLEPLRKL